MGATRKVCAVVALESSAVVLHAATAAGGPEVASDSYCERVVAWGFPIDIAGEVTSEADSRPHSPRDPVW